MKKGQEYSGLVEKINFPNKGIVDIEGTKVSIKGTLPGQRVRFVVSKKRSGRCEGRLLEVEEKSDIENREKLCPHFPECGGCTYQNLSYENQLDLKMNQVKTLIDGVCDDYEFEGIIGSPSEWEYRNKMEFSFGDEFKGGPLALGMHKKGSFHDIVNISECKLVDEDYNQVLKTVKSHFENKNIKFYHKMNHEGYLRHLLIRRSITTNEMTISLVTTSDEPDNVEIEKLVNDLLDLNLNGKIVGILNIINDSLADVVKSDETRILFGKDFFYEEILGLKFKISTFSFFQTNSLGAEVLYKKAREYVGETKDKIIFDLYSGTGTIAQMLAPVARKIVGVEIVEEAVEAAIENAKLNNLENCEFVAGDVLKVIDEIKEKPDIIVLDPPRDGIHPKALNKIIDFGVDRIIYISCKPTSLVRDLEVFFENGYKMEKACAVDMFPQTVHVETIVALYKKDVKK